MNLFASKSVAHIAPLVTSILPLIATSTCLVRCKLFEKGVERLDREEHASIQELAVTMYPFYRHIHYMFSQSRLYTTVFKTSFVCALTFLNEYRINRAEACLMQMASCGLIPISNLFSFYSDRAYTHTLSNNYFN